MKFCCKSICGEILLAKGQADDYTGFSLELVETFSDYTAPVPIMSNNPFLYSFMIVSHCYFLLLPFLL